MQLHDYQQDAITRVYENDYTLIDAAMGAGKTAIALHAAVELIDDEVIDRVLWVAPARVRDLVVKQEEALWKIGLGVAVANGNDAQRRKCFCADVVVISYEAIQWLCQNIDELLGGVRWMLVLDESTRMKNPRSKRYKALKKHVDRFAIRIAMTGTPVTQGPEDLFAPQFLLDKGQAFGKSYDKFLRRYFIPINDYQWAPAAGSVEMITEKVAPHTFQLAGYELPEISHYNLDVLLPPEARSMYEQIQQTFVLDTDAGEVTIGADAVLTTKLRQIVDGFIYADEGQEQWLHDAKLDAIQELIDTREPLIIVYTYTAQLHRMRGLWPGPHLGGGTSKREAEQAVDDWNAGKLKRLYLHPASAGHGLNLQRGGATVVFASLPWSLEQYQQTIARVHRQGQTRGVRVFHVTALDTIDQAVVKALRGKRSVQAAVQAELGATQTVS